MSRNLKRIDDMRTNAVIIVCRHIEELLEVLSFIYVPIAVQPRLPDLRRQGFKLLDVVGLSCHQSLVVSDERLNEAILFRILILTILPSDEQSLNPLVTYSACIAGQVNALRILVDGSDTRHQHSELLFGELSRLVYEHNVRLCALKPVQVLVVSQIAKKDLAAVREVHLLFGVVVPV